MDNAANRNWQFEQDGTIYVAKRRSCQMTEGDETQGTSFAKKWTLEKVLAEPGSRFSYRYNFGHEGHEAAAVWR